jgi:hypothetical protein
MFLVRFTPHVTFKASPLTYVVKHCERPKVSIKTEELNQYNKKRHIYTGFKHEPIKITFYDSAGGTAQNMWTAYSRYYFGDFMPQGASGYSYDVITNQWNAGSGFGLTETYAGDTSMSAQWFFHDITIFHFYDRLFDQYTLLNPRISNYEPDELDYEDSKVSQINMQFVYENLQYKPGQTVTSDLFPEFADAFMSRGFAVPPTGHPTPLSSTVQNITPANPPVSSLLTNVIGGTAGAAPYRADSAMTSTGALNPYGNFSFGTYNPTSSMDASNGAASFMIPSGTAMSTKVSGSQFDMANASSASMMTTPYGGMDSTLTSAALATGAPAALNLTAAQMYGTSTTPSMTPTQMYGGSSAPVMTPTQMYGGTAPATGVTPTPSALVAMNTQQTGTAQFGVNIPNFTAASTPGNITFPQYGTGLGS